MAVPSQNKWWGLNQEGYLAEQIKYVDQSDYIRPDGGRWSAEVNPGLFMGAKRLTAMHRQTGCLKWPHVCPTLRWKAQVSQLRVKRLKKWWVSQVSPASEHGITHWFVRSWCEAVSWIFLLGPSQSFKWDEQRLGLTMKSFYSICQSHFISQWAYPRYFSFFTLTVTIIYRMNSVFYLMWCK